MNSQVKSFQVGDLILLIGEDNRRWVTTLREAKFSTAKGVCDLASLVGQLPGCALTTHIGYRLFAFRPTPADLVMHAVRRETQIAYPKEMGYLLLRTGVVPGAVVVECGTGSGSSTLMFAAAVGDEGKVYSYERRQEFSELARRNLQQAGLLHRVVLKNKDIGEGFDEQNADVVFLDVRTPWEYLNVAWQALSPGGHLCVLVPTTNQVCETLRELTSLPFADVEVCELLVRFYKPNPDRLRPEDRMVAHTAYLILARKTSEIIGY